MTFNRQEPFLPNNIEIKARLENIEKAHHVAKSISGDTGTKLLQLDTFFKTHTGRLKLRDFLDGTGELIFYIRENTIDPVGSYYQKTSTEDVDGLRLVLSNSLSVIGEVEKIRYLYMFGRTRIHIDNVKNLGSYLELEVVLSEGENQIHGVAEARDIMEKLSIKPDQLIHCAYIDLLTGNV